VPGSSDNARRPARLSGSHSTAVPSVVRITSPSIQDREAFLAAVSRSVSLHRPWTSAPSTNDQFAQYLARHDGTTAVSFLAKVAEVPVGVVNVSQIVRGAFQSAYLGYYAFAPNHRRGYMTQALASVVTRAFRQLGLHRLEANIQPENTPSIALVRKLGFRQEGFSRRYLKIRGRWRDHERWAIIKEDWSPSR
jgi:ribosomal-protein-alanine N-acetyltransferase